MRKAAGALLFGAVTLALLATEDPYDHALLDDLEVGALEELAIQGEVLLSEDANEVPLRLRAVLYEPESAWLELSFSGQVTQSEGRAAADAGVLGDFVDASLVTEGLQEPLRQTFLTGFGLRGRAAMPPQCQNSPPSCEVELVATLARRSTAPGAVRVAWSVSLSGFSANPADGGPSNSPPWTLELVTGANPVDADLDADSGAGAPLPEAE